MAVINIDNKSKIINKTELKENCVQDILWDLEENFDTVIKTGLKKNGIKNVFLDLEDNSSIINIIADQREPNTEIIKYTPVRYHRVVYFDFVW